MKKTILFLLCIPIIFGTIHYALFHHNATPSIEPLRKTNKSIAAVIQATVKQAQQATDSLQHIQNQIEKRKQHIQTAIKTKQVQIKTQINKVKTMATLVVQDSNTSKSNYYDSLEIIADNWTILSNGYDSLIQEQTLQYDSIVANQDFHIRLLEYANAELEANADSLIQTNKQLLHQIQKENRKAKWRKVKHRFLIGAVLAATAYIGYNHLQ